MYHTQYDKIVHAHAHAMFIYHFPAVENTNKPIVEIYQGPLSLKLSIPFPNFNGASTLIKCTADIFHAIVSIWNK